MKLLAQRGVDYNQRLLHYSTSKPRPHLSPEIPQLPARIRVCRRILISRCRLSIRNSGENCEESGEVSRGRRGIVLTPLLVVGASFLRSTVVKAEEKVSEAPIVPAEKVPEAPIVPAQKVEKVEEITSRIYDATAIGEPLAVGKDKSKVWEKVMNARIVYLGEAEQVPIRDDKELELEIVKNLRKRCIENDRTISLAFEAFPCNLQEQLNQFMDRRIDGDALRSYTAHWPPERWQEYEPLLGYCRDNEVRLVACGAPLEVMRTVQAEGIRGLSKADRKKYTPPAGSGFTSGFNAFSRKSSKELTSLNEALTFGPSSYLTVQARAVEDYTMAQVILQAVTDGGASGLLVVITGATHVMYGPRGTGIPARISKKMQKKNQVVMLLNPERKSIRRE